MALGGYAQRAPTAVKDSHTAGVKPKAGLVSKKQDFRPLGLRHLQMQFKRLATTLQLAAFLALVFGQAATTEDKVVDGFTLTDKHVAFVKL